MKDVNRSKRHIVEYGHMRKQVEGLEDHADLGTECRQFAPFLRQAFAVNEDNAAVNGFKPVNGTAQRGFSGTGRTDDDNDLAFVDGQ